jgi:hypothetical protein
LEAQHSGLRAADPAHRDDRGCVGGSHTQIDGTQRANGLIVLHGMQGQRTWSWVINESSGEGTLTTSSDGDGVVIFSACTPIERLEKPR